MRNDVIETVIKKEIRGSYPTDKGVYALCPELFDMCYEDFNITKDEKNIILSISTEIIDYINQEKIDIDSELQNMKIQQLFDKYDLNLFLMKIPHLN